MAAGNPLYDIHAAIWAMLEDKTCATHLLTNTLHFTDLVATGCRKKMTGTVWDFLRDSRLGADFPECAVVQTGIEAGDRALGCNATALDLTYEVWIATGQQPAERLWDVQFAVFCQWQNWEAHVKVLTWSSEEYLWNVDLLKSEDSLLLTKLNKTIKGWSSVWNGVVHCYFNPSDLIA